MPIIQPIPIDAGPYELGRALAIQATLFPTMSAREDYFGAYHLRTGNRYWLLYAPELKERVGVSGIYTIPSDPGSAWLGWFGILEPFRRKGFASEALRLFEQEARKRGFLTARLYTHADNKAACAFYEKSGYAGEEYRRDDDPAGMEYGIRVYSKSLYGERCEPWGNRMLGLTEAYAKYIGQ